MFIWTIGDAITAVLVALMLLTFGLISLSQAIRTWRCPHDGNVNETSACEAICQKCGANLGFIGTWRERHRHHDASERKDG